RREFETPTKYASSTKCGASKDAWNFGVVAVAGTLLSGQVGQSVLAGKMAQRRRCGHVQHGRLRSQDWRGFVI
ncbi:hypothetical protein U1Q18_051806, partial [Sarracenia purpurea var. burkii]